MRTYRYVILGGGMVAGYAAKELVERGLGRGELAIVSSDAVPPYERPPLSKGFLAGTEAEESVYINPRPFYDDHAIDLSLATVVTGIDRQRKRLRTHAGGEIGFEKLLIATGAQVRTLDLSGAGLPGIYYLRSLDDAKQIKMATHSATGLSHHRRRLRRVGAVRPQRQPGCGVDPRVPSRRAAPGRV